MEIGRVNIIGAGSLGGYTSLLAGKMSPYLGCHLSVFDFDSVELKNVQNQIYRSSDAGHLKIHALRKILRFVNGIPLKVENKKVAADTDLSGVVVVLVDSMKARKEIFQASQYKADVIYYIEARTGGNVALVYAFDPRDRDWVLRYEKTLYSDEGAANLVCALPETVPTLWMVASVIASILVRLNNQRIFRNEFLETVINMEDLLTMSTLVYNPS